MALPVLRRIPCVPPHDLMVELETRFVDNVDGETRDILRDIIVQMEHTNTMFEELYKFACVVKYHSLEISKQAITIAAGDLSTSTTAPPAWHSKANDLLTVASTTDVEFDYRDFWKTGKFVLSPGKGVYYLKVIPALDQEYPDILESETAVYAYGATQLQLVQWNDPLSRWEAQTWAVGWTVWHWLAGPPGGFE